MSAQNETNYWFFGNYAGINFNTTPPTVLTNGSLTTIEGCAAMSDQNGNLVLYSDGSVAYNWQHQVIANGTGLNGNSSSTQSCIILKKPGGGQIYYIFSQQGFNVSNGGCYYSIVDMSLAAGAGSVITKNVSMYQPSTEKLVATKHCNGIDYWIITRDANAALFRCFLLTSAGVSNIVVTSPASGIANSAQVGYLKVSPNGRKLASCSWYSTSAYDIYDFDNSTGLITNSIPLSLGGSNSAYSCEFSPDGTKLYGGIYSAGSVYQWDLCAGSPSAIAASSIQVFPGPGSKGAYQLAPDGKIYISRINSGTLAVINNPNLAGTNCGYVELGFSISPKVCSYGLPNVITSGLKASIPPFTHTVSNSFGCQTASFTAPPILQNFTLVSCAASGYSLTGMQWNFGDPSSGSNNISNAQNPAHAFTNLGTYTVSLVVYFSCGGGTDTIRQVVNINQPCISVSSASITCASLGSATVNATGGIGPFSYTWTPGQQTSSVATGLQPGQYTITVFDFGNNFTYTALVSFNSLIPLAGNISTASSITCHGASTGTGQVSNLTGGSGNQFYLWTNGVQSYTTAFTNSLSAGIWSVDVTDALTGCQINQSFLVSQPPAATVVLSASSPSTCAGDTIVLTGLSAGGTPGYTYAWSNGPTNPTTSVTQTLAGTPVYTLSVLDANNCTTTKTISVDFVPNPLVSVSNVSICPLKTGTLVAGGASTYTWYPAVVSLSTTGSAYTGSPTSSEEYTVVGSALGCTSMATASIILHPLPIPQVQSNTPRCEGTSVFLNASGGSSYKWSGPSGFSSSAANNTIVPLGLQHAGVYNVTVTSANSCTAPASVTVDVEASPALAASASTVCTTQTLTLVANALPGLSYMWIGPMSFNSSQPNPVLANPAVGRTGIYTVVVTSTLGCSRSSTVHGLVIAPPSLTLALSNHTVCHQSLNGSPTTITLASSGASSYSLYSPVPVGLSAAIPAISTLTVQAPYSSMPVAVTSTVEGSNGVCSSFSTFDYTVIPNPVISVSTATAAICVGQQFNFTANGASAYTWSASTKHFTIASHSAGIVTKPPVTSTFTVYGSSVGCKSSSHSLTLTVNDLPTLKLSPINPTICLHEKIGLKASGTGSSYQWSPLIGIYNPFADSVSATPPSSQTYTVVSTLNNCTTSATIKLEVFSLPQPTITSLTQSVCVGGMVNLQGAGGLSYEWRGPMSSSYNGQSIEFAAHHPGLAGHYTLTVTDVNGCKNSTAEKVDIHNLPSGSMLNFKGEGCEPYCATFNFSGNTNSSVSQWSIENALFNGDNFEYCFNSAGTYSILGEITDGQTSCKNNIQYLVTVHPKPEANFNFTPIAPVEDLDEVIFSDNSTGQDLSWNWFFDNTSVHSSQSQNPKFLYSDAGLFPVALVVNTKFNCADTIIKTVTVSNDFSIFVPNAFTPNGDQKNDTFKPVIGSGSKYMLKVYNRWGQEIFHAKDIQTGWDGTFNGLACQQDVYTWQIELTTYQGERILKTGTVTLIR